MAGIHSDHSVHRIVSGEAPVVGLEVITNNLDRGRIVIVESEKPSYPGGPPRKCGWYCEAWHTVELHTSYKGEALTGTTIMNCERLTTRMPS